MGLECRSRPLRTSRKSPEPHVLQIQSMTKIIAVRQTQERMCTRNLFFFFLTSKKPILKGGMYVLYLIRF